MSRCKNAALRFATGTKIFKHITPIYKDKEILTFAARRDFLVICLLASVLRTQKPQYLSERIQFVPAEKQGSLRRFPLDITVGKFRLECLRDSFYVGAAYLWNRVPREIRRVYERPCFKTLLYKHILVKNSI